VADLLDVHVATVYRQIAEGRCPVVRFGRCVRIPIEAFHQHHPGLRKSAVAAR
jgi:excisionase family DNA binding protein